MEYNRNNQNQNYRRDYNSKPYDRGPPRGRGGGNFRRREDDFRTERADFRSRQGNFRTERDDFRPREDNFRTERADFRSREDNFRTERDNFRSRDQQYGSSGDNRGSRGQQNWRQRGSSSRGNHSNFNQEAWNAPERTFDERGREIGRHEMPQSSFSQKRSNHNHEEEHQDEGATALPVNPLEEKARDFLHTVLRQGGIRSKLIFLETVENSLQTLQGTADYFQLQMIVDQLPTGDFVMKIAGEEIARGPFASKQLAKNGLAEQAMTILRKDCFYIVKKKVYEEVTTKKNEPKVEEQPQPAFQGSKAHQMMLKMGWGGKGLGVKEQGVEKTVAETLDQNVSRQGLGTDDVFKKIHKLLEDYSKSDKITLLRFDPDFTSEERAHIHKMAQKFGLKSKSEGKGDERRITVTKKLHRGDLVYNLLVSGLENDLYRLIIPSKFEHLWEEEDDED